VKVSANRDVCYKQRAVSELVLTANKSVENIHIKTVHGDTMTKQCWAQSKTRRHHIKATEKLIFMTNCALVTL
jgi:O-glycosyl hydrolase